MYSYPLPQASPLMNATLQTLLLFVLPLAAAFLLGNVFGFWAHFKQQSKRSAAINGGLPVWQRTVLPFGYLGMMPLLTLLCTRLFLLQAGLTAALLITLGGIVYLALIVYGVLHALDNAVLQTAQASGLNRRLMILRVRIPMGKNRLMQALCESALYLLALQAAAGCASSAGLFGLAVQSTIETDGLMWLWCLLLLIPIFLTVILLAVYFRKKAES